FDDEHSPVTNYNYSSDDVNYANIELTATVQADGLCTASSADVLGLYLQEAPYLYFPEQYVTACDNAPDVTASVYTYGYTSGGAWSSNGSGTFDDLNSTYTTYHASDEDIANGCVDLIFTATGSGLCGGTSGSMNACFISCSKAGRKQAVQQARVTKQLYPNPAVNIINIKNTTVIDKKQAYITDASGRIMPCNWASANSLNISGFAKGIYLLHIKSDRGNQVLKFIKQ
ncbi:MAG: T9SS type A sorting domain-containing protein, partial [Ginsengibacter sp.]